MDSTNLNADLNNIETHGCEKFEQGDCFDHYNCCDCGTPYGESGRGCAYCFSCNACEYCYYYEE